MRLTAVLSGYSTVAQAAEVLRLASRSVRDLIYSGRLPSVRIGRVHFIRGTDLERERRRRLGLPLPRPRAYRRVARPSEHQHVDPALRAQRAAERLAARGEWAAQHRPSPHAVPFRARTVTSAGEPVVCASCHRPLPPGSAIVEQLSSASQPQARLCARCGRRALLAWSDQRRAEAAAARDLAQHLSTRTGGEPADRLAA
jgi:excisionase family DNA binding protein